MAQPKFKPRHIDEEPWLDLSGPPVRENSTDTDSFEEWDDEEEECDDYDTEEEEAKEEEEDDDEVGLRISDIEEESEKNLHHDTEKLNQNKVKTDGKELENLSKLEFEKDEVLPGIYIVNSELLTLLENVDNNKYLAENKPRKNKKLSKIPDDENVTIKEKFKNHIGKVFREWTDNQQEVQLRPGVPFRNLEFTRKQGWSKELDNSIVEEDEYLSDVEENQVIDFIPEPKPKPKLKSKHNEKTIVDEDEFVYDLKESVERDIISSPYPEELVPVPEFGSEQWKQLMEQITYKNPYEGYVPKETREPADAIWSRIEYLDYQQGRYVDEDMFDDSPPVTGPITMKEIEELMERIKQGVGPVPYSYEKG